MRPWLFLQIKIKAMHIHGTLAISKDQDKGNAHVYNERLVNGKLYHLKWLTIEFFFN